MPNAEPPRVAIVEDEADLREAMAAYLTAHGFDVRAYGSSASFRHDADALNARVAILDISLAGEDGLSLAGFIRARGGAGIIMATAHGASLDRAIGLETGADDYLVKPFELRELLARVKALLRRLPAETADVLPDQPPAALRFGGIEVDFARRGATRDGAPLILTETEYALLEFLAGRPGRAATPGAIAAAMGRPGASPGAVKTAISRLRSKIERDPAKPRHVKTAEGGGYVFEA